MKCNFKKTERVSIFSKKEKNVCLLGSDAGGFGGKIGWEKICDEKNCIFIKILKIGKKTR